MDTSILNTNRSNDPAMLCKKGGLKYFAKSPFLNNTAGLRPGTFFKQMLWHRCFPVNSAKFLRKPFLI